MMKNPPPEISPPPLSIPENFIPPVKQPPVQPKKQQSIFTMRTLFIILILLGLGVGLFFMWRGSDSSAKSVCSDQVTSSAPIVAETGSPITKPSASPNLLSRLHKIAE